VKEAQERGGWIIDRLFLILVLTKSGAYDMMRTEVWRISQRPEIERAGARRYSAVSETMRRVLSWLLVLLLQRWRE
jgi:hypothetical protein